LGVEKEKDRDGAFQVQRLNASFSGGLNLYIREGVGASEQLGPGQRVLQKLTGVGLPENYRESIAIGGLIIQTMLKTHLAAFSNVYLYGERNVYMS